MFDVPFDIWAAAASALAGAQVFQITLLCFLVATRRRKRPPRTYVLPNGLIVDQEAGQPPQPVMQPRLDPVLQRAQWKAAMAARDASRAR